MRKKLIVLFCALMALSTALFAVNTITFAEEATPLESATLTFEGLEDTGVFTSLEVDESTGITAIATANGKNLKTIKEKGGEKYIEFRALSTEASSLRFAIRDGVKKGERYKVSLKLALSENFVAGTEDRDIFFRYGTNNAEGNRVILDKYFKNPNYGEENEPEYITGVVKEISFETTVAADSSYAYIYVYTQENCGYDLYSFTINEIVSEEFALSGSNGSLTVENGITQVRSKVDSGYVCLRARPVSQYVTDKTYTFEVKLKLTDPLTGDNGVGTDSSGRYIFIRKFEGFAQKSFRGFEDAKGNKASETSTEWQTVSTTTKTTTADNGSKYIDFLLYIKTGSGIDYEYLRLVDPVAKATLDFTAFTNNLPAYKTSNNDTLAEVSAAQQSGCDAVFKADDTNKTIALTNNVSHKYSNIKFVMNKNFEVGRKYNITINMSISNFGATYDNEGVTDPTDPQKRFIFFREDGNSADLDVKIGNNLFVDGETVVTDIINVVDGQFTIEYTANQGSNIFHIYNFGAAGSKIEIKSITIEAVEFDVVYTSEGEQVAGAYVKDDSVTLARKTAHSSGYTFVGWYNEELGLYKEGATVNVSAGKQITFEAVYLKIDTLDGAKIKKDSPTGLRFETEFSITKEILLTNSVVAKTLIAPKDYVEMLADDAEFTATNIDAIDDLFVDEGYNKYVEAVAKNLVNNIDDGGKIGFVGNLTNIRSYNFAREFSARAYVVITYAGGDTAEFYSNFDIDNNSRSVYDVAVKAYNSNNEDAEAKTVYAGFISKVVNLVSDGEGYAIATTYGESQEYILPEALYTVSVEDGVIIVTAKEDSGWTGYTQSGSKNDDDWYRASIVIDGERIAVVQHSKMEKEPAENNVLVLSTSEYRVQSVGLGE